MMPVRNCISAALLLILFPAQSLAGAWLQPWGEGVRITSFNAYRADNYYNEDGHKRNQLRFTKLEQQTYLEYGVSHDYTIGLSLFVPTVMQETGGGTLTRSGVSDLELFARRKIWQDGGEILSTQAMLKLPLLYSTNNVLNLGDGQIDMEGRLLYGFGSAPDEAGASHYINIEAAYRRRTSLPRDELRLDLTLGLKRKEGWELMLQSFHTHTLGDAARRNFNPTFSANRRLHKGQISILFRYDDETRIQAGIYTDISGRNTGAGNGVILSIWRSFEWL